MNADVPLPLTKPVMVATPVPPLETGKMPLSFVMSLVAISVKSDPFQAIKAARPDATVTPVVAAAFTVTFWLVDVEFRTKNTLLVEGAVIVKALAGLPVQLRI